MPSRPRPALLRSLSLTAGLFVAQACADRAVAWEPAEFTDSVLLPGAELVFDVAGRAGVIERWTPPLTPEGDRCQDSLRGAMLRADTAWAVWWAPQRGGGMRLLAARSTDGGLNWGASIAVEATDAGRGGCERPAPALALEPATGVPQVAFTAPEQGRWVLRLRAIGGATTTAAREIARGDSALAASVAVDGARVVVAYREVRGAIGTVWLALAPASGQIPIRRSSVASGGRRVSTPLVAIRGTQVAVAWNQSLEDRGPSQAAVRVGRLR